MLSRVYTFFAAHVRLLLLGYACFVLLSLMCLTMVKQEENIEALLPDSTDTSVRRDFAWLQKAPFARKVLIDLYLEHDSNSLAASGESAPISSAQFKQVAIDVSAALPASLFTHAFYAPPVHGGQHLGQDLLQTLPSLVTATDLQQIAQRLQPQSIDNQLHRVRDQLLTPQGWWTKASLRSDPLQLWQIAAGHLRQLNPLANADQRQRDFVSRDGYHRLVVADTDIAISDIAGSRKLLAAVHQCIADTVPPGITVTVVSGHQYSLANAQTIQRDIKVVLGTATVTILLIFVLLLRSWRAIFVFFLPASVLGIAAAAVASVFPVVSGITVGFGAVLLGITVDYTLHVYFALRGSSQPQEQLRRLTAPLFGSALTSFLAFSVLLSSSLPEQRQLAVFSLSAIVLALLLAVVVMPHLCGEPMPGSMAVYSDSSQVSPLLPKVRHRNVLMVIVWFSVLLVCSVAIPRLHFDGDLRSLGVSTEALQRNEQMVKQVWGNMRTSALLFARGKDLESALVVNDAIYRVVCHDDNVTNRGDNHKPQLVSVASILPSKASQEHSQELWRNFWQTQRPLAIKQLQRAGAEQGFSSVAFQPFTQWLKKPVVPIDLKTWQQAGLGTLLGDLIVVDRSSGGADRPAVAIISLLDEVELTAQLQHDLAAVPDAIVVAQGIFRQQLSSELAEDFRNFIFMAFAAVVLVLICWYRRWRYVVLALLPVVSGLLLMFGGMGWLGLSFNLFNVIAAILIIGLGVDYAIFMLSRCDGSGCRQSDRAVLVSALTTLAGFGSLVLAQHPAMYSIGISVILGISGAALSALLVLPTCYAWIMPK